MLPNHKLVDTHAHICDPLFDGDRADVLRNAASAGVGAVIAVGENISDAHKNLELSAAHPMLRPAAGLYPTILDPAQAEEMIDFIRKERSRLFAIGEVGLDFWIVKEMSTKIFKEISLKVLSRCPKSWTCRSTSTPVRRAGMRLLCCSNAVPPGFKCMPLTVRHRPPCRRLKPATFSRSRPRWCVPGRNKSLSKACRSHVSCWKPTVPCWDPIQMSATSRPM